ncbi:MAG: hypothetical protein KAS16_03175, partial [Thermoplasmata archaeon]|nr:hypothetical protein [Thermoplasmata archaeon]
ALEGYLDQATTSSGTVPMALVSGQDIGWDMGPQGTEPDTVWLADYLAAIYLQDDADGGGGDEGGGNGANKGIDPFEVDNVGHPLNDIYNFDNMPLEQDVYGAGRFWPDGLELTTNINGDMGIEVWDYVLSKDNTPDDVGGIAQESGGAAGTARIMYEGFSHDMLDSTGSGGNWDPAGVPPIIDPLRAGLLDETVQWLLGGNHPTIDLLGPVGDEYITAAASWPITWSVAGAQSVDVYYSPNSGQEYIKINPAPLPGGQTFLLWDISTLEDADTYRIKVVALGSATYSTLSDYSESTDFEIDHDIDTIPPITIPGSVGTNLNPITPGQPVVLTATIDDSTTGMSNIQAAEWRVEFGQDTTPNWGDTANNFVMTAADGTFNEMIEGVTADIDGAETLLWPTGAWHELWVRGQDSAGNWAGSYETDIFVSGAAAAPEQYSTSVVEGWQFISFPLDVSGTVDEILNDGTFGDGNTDWSMAMWYDTGATGNHWKSYNKAYVALGGTADLLNLDNVMGVWVYITASTGDGELTLGKEGYFPTTTDIDLVAGWNLVGFPSQDAGFKLSDLTALSANVLNVERYNVAGAYLLEDMAANDVFAGGQAYWIYCDGAYTWTVSY